MIADMALFALAALVLSAALWWPVHAYVQAGGDLRRKMPLVVAAGVGLAVIAAYMAIGRPDLSGASYETRLRELASRNPMTFTPEETIAVLSDAARRNPTDARPMIYLGRLEAAQGRADHAVRAFEEALRRDPRSAETMIDLGRVLVASNEGVVTAQARALFEQASELNAADPVPWFYQALAATREGREDDAQRLWRETQARLPANDPRRAMVSQMLAESRQ